MSLFFPLYFWEPKLDKIRWSGQSEKESLIIFPSAILSLRNQYLELCEIGRRTKGSEENRREVGFRFL